MKKRRWRILSLIATLAILTSVPLKADVLEKTMKVGGTTVHYKVVIPSNYDPSKPYPGVLGFGGGPQTMNVVDNVIVRNFRDKPKSAATSSWCPQRRTTSCSLKAASRSSLSS
jgi:hypothetical protein